MFSLIRKTRIGRSSSSVLPADPRLSDLYLVEFPKSGLTWLSTLVANTLCKANGSRLKATYFNVQQMIPDLHMSTSVGPPFFAYPGYRIMKSHAKYMPQYKHVVYLLRNPVSVMVSYYNYCAENRLFSGGMEEFIRDDKYGVTAYTGHVNSWLKTSPGSGRLHMIRYEDLLAQPGRVIGDLFENLGLEGVSSEMREEAVHASSLTEMKRMESNYKNNDPAYNRTFVRKGHEYPGSEELSPTIERYIKERTSEILARFYTSLL